MLQMRLSEMVPACILITNWSGYIVNIYNLWHMHSHTCTHYNCIRLFTWVISLAADEEECKVGLIAEEVTKKQKDCEEDLRKAEPALAAAQEALNTLNKVE